MLVIVVALALTAGAIFVYAGNSANRGTAWYAEKVTPVSGHLAAGSPMAADSLVRDTIAGLAAEIALREGAQWSAHCLRLQKRLWHGLSAAIPCLQLNGPEPGPKRIATNLNISTEFIEGESQVLLCDMHGIAVAGAASCVSKSLKISHVLSAIGLSHALA